MATTTVRYTCPNIGNVWSTFIAVWYEYLGMGSGTISSSVTTDSSMKAVTMSRTVGADTVTNFWCAADIVSDAVKVPLPYVVGSPGWRSMPLFARTVHGSYTTVDFFEAYAQPIRRAILTSICGATLIGSTKDTRTLPGLTDFTLYQYTDRYQLGPVVLTDAYCLTVATPSATMNLQAYAQTTDGLLAGSPMVIVGNGTSQSNVDAIVGALNDIAMIDVDYTANQGRAIFSMRGRVNSGT